MKNLRNIGRKYGPQLAAVAATGGSLMAHADTAVFDPSTYVTSITGTAAGMLLVGGAVFGVYLAIKSVKWAMRAL